MSDYLEDALTETESNPDLCLDCREMCRHTAGSSFTYVVLCPKHAAAPELMLLAQAVIKLFNSHCGLNHEPFRSQEEHDLYYQAKAVIAKAEAS